MTRLFVRHTVGDYDAWRKVFDEFGDVQTQMGATSIAVYRSVDDPNDITVSHDFATVDQAKAFASSDSLHEAMGRAGVASKPEVWFTEEA
jgi:hypothetical protein